MQTSGKFHIFQLPSTQSIFVTSCYIFISWFLLKQPLFVVLLVHHYFCLLYTDDTKIFIQGFVTAVCFPCSVCLFSSFVLSNSAGVLHLIADDDVHSSCYTAFTESEGRGTSNTRTGFSSHLSVAYFLAFVDID